MPKDDRGANDRTCHGDFGGVSTEHEISCRSAYYIGALRKRVMRSVLLE